MEWPGRPCQSAARGAEVATVRGGVAGAAHGRHIKDAGQLARLEPACESSSLARPADQLLD